MLSVCARSSSNLGVLVSNNSGRNRRFPTSIIYVFTFIVMVDLHSVSRLATLHINDIRSVAIIQTT
jgi:hypothetical protein